MLNVKLIRKSHRYLGLIIGIQLLFWTVSGFYFSWVSIDTIHGDDLIAQHEMPADTNLVALGEIIGQLEAVDLINSTMLRHVMGEPVYDIVWKDSAGGQSQIFDAKTGQYYPEITKEDAIEIAKYDFSPNVDVRSATLLTKVPADSEYREKPLPAWRIEFEHESETRIYVSVNHVAVTARRNGSWRIFDFLWMFHILDFEARDNFNTWLLQGFAMLGIITVLSGFLLAGVTSPLFRKKKPKKKKSTKKMSSSGVKPATLDIK